MHFLFAFLLALPCLAAPRLSCDGVAHDFGAVTTTGSVSHVFILANTGDAPLTIDWVRACCGVTADLATNAVAAGTNTTLRLTLALDKQTGQVRKAVYVMSNDPKNPIYRLALTATVAAPGLVGGR